MYLFLKIKDLASNTDDFHFYFTPIDCRNKRDIFRFISSTILLGLFTLSNRKIVYYSSEAVEVENSKYAFFKKLHEKMLRKTDLIIRIPHVYSADRDKGLIKVLKDGTFVGDKDILLEYITDTDFREYFIRVCDKEGIQKYNGEYHSDSVSEIERKFVTDETCKTKSTEG